MTQLKLQDFFKELENNKTLTQSSQKDQHSRYEEEHTKTETNVSFHSFKIRRSLDKEDYSQNFFGVYDKPGVYSHYSEQSQGDKSNTFTAGVNSQGVKSTEKQAPQSYGLHERGSNLKSSLFKGFDFFVANQNQDMEDRSLAGPYSYPEYPKQVSHSQREQSDHDRFIFNSQSHRRLMGDFEEQQENELEQKNTFQTKRIQQFEGETPSNEIEIQVGQLFKGYFD